jgi:hypothetical protein|tara:strand:+ start:98 stop:427 length:330 start_codon:yes stop_codon:yes gene_type:complete
MKMINKILSLLLAFVFISSNFHIIDSANFTKAGNYSFCDIDCEHNEHSLIDNDCEICNNQVRQTFNTNTSTKKSFFSDTKNLIFQPICIITSDNSFGLFLSRAPPSNIL